MAHQILQLLCIDVCPYVIAGKLLKSAVKCYFLTSRRGSYNQVSCTGLALPSADNAGWPDLFASDVWMVSLLLKPLRVEYFITVAIICASYCQDNNVHCVLALHMHNVHRVLCPQPRSASPKHKYRSSYTKSAMIEMKGKLCEIRVW